MSFQIYSPAGPYAHLLDPNGLLKQTLPEQKAPHVLARLSREAERANPAIDALLQAAEDFDPAGGHPARLALTNMERALCLPPFRSEVLNPGAVARQVNRSLGADSETVAQAFGVEGASEVVAQVLGEQGAADLYNGVLQLLILRDSALPLAERRRVLNGSGRVDDDSIQLMRKQLAERAKRVYQLAENVESSL